MNPGARPTPFAAGINAAPSSGAASSFGGSGSSGLQTQSAPATFVIPGTYGQAPIRLTAGEGRLARPLFRFTGTVAVGFDDNVFESPTRGPSVPKQVVQEQVIPATQAHTAQVQVQQADGTIVTETVEVPASPATTVGVPIAAVNAAKRQASLVSRGVVGWDVQFASRRTVFTFDLNAGDDYYWDRPGSKSDYNGSLALAFLHKLSERATTTANITASYQSQPNLGQVNTSTSNNVGPYLNVNAKVDLSYRLLPRFTAVTSISYNTVLYEQSAQEANSFGATIFGTELRYLFSPTVTLLGDFRYGSTSYNTDSTRDSTTYYLLGGADLTLSRRFTATIRLGEEVRSFSDSGDSKSTPYIELTANYNLTRTTSLSGNLHYGFEEPPDANTSVKTFRGGISLGHAFTPRLSGNLSLNLVSQVSVSTEPGLATTTLTENTAEASMGISYTLSRHWNFSLNYTYTQLFSAGNALDFYRNRIFLTGNYTF